MDESGLKTVRSQNSVKTTIDRLAQTVESKGLLVFARIDHSANAAEIGLTLRPTELLIFGNPKAGTPLMQDQQTVGIDLPVKALAWEDSAGAVWLTYIEAEWMSTRHRLRPGCDAIIMAIDAGLVAVAGEACGP
jgi:uncharacterized protein (DUF302 family)